MRDADRWLSAFVSVSTLADHRYLGPCSICSIAGHHHLWDGDFFQPLSGGSTSYRRNNRKPTFIGRTAFCNVPFRFFVRDQSALDGSGRYRVDSFNRIPVDVENKTDKSKRDYPNRAEYLNIKENVRLFGITFFAFHSVIISKYRHLFYNEDR